MKIVKIPSNFLLDNENINETIFTLSELTRNTNTDLAIDFSNIIQIGKSELLVLAAQIEKSILIQRNKIFRHGSIPNINRVKKILTSSNFIFHVNRSIDSNELSDAEKAKLINVELIDSVVKDLKKIGIKEYYYPFNVFLTELIGNAVEHGITTKNINWWLTHEIDRKNQRVIYTFVDMGMGIIESHKMAGLPFRYRFKKDREIVLDSLYGHLQSSTKEANRGRGLQQIKEMIVKSIVSNAVLITNTVSLNYQNERFIDGVNNDFVGTYYRWTISKENVKTWRNTK